MQSQMQIGYTFLIFQRKMPEKQKITPGMNSVATMASSQHKSQSNVERLEAEINQINMRSKF